AGLARPAARLPGRRGRGALGRLAVVEGQPADRLRPDVPGRPGAALARLPERPVTSGARRLAACGLLALAISGCSGRALPRNLALREAVAARRYATGETPSGSGLWFYRAPQILPFTFDGERRTAVLTSVDPWRWKGVVPRGGELHAGVQILPEGWRIVRGLKAWVVAMSGGEREVIDVVRTSERRRPQWLDFTADLSRWA